MPSRFSRLELPALCLIVIAASTASLGEDWFQFRGPDGDGHSSAVGLPTHWSSTENIGWRTPIAGKGWSSPVSFGTRIFLTTAVPSGKMHSLHALAVDAHTGKILWDVQLFDSLKSRAARIHAKNSHASPTPIADGQHVFVHFGTHGTACLSVDGKVRWKTREIDYAPNHGSGGSPVLVDDLLIFNCDGSDRQFVVALDAETGRIRWRRDRPPCPEPKRFAFATPLVIQANGHKQIVSPGAHLVVSYDAKTGQEIWTARYQGYSVIPRPVFRDGLVFFSTSYDSSVLLAVRTDGHGDVSEDKIAWRQNRSIPYTPSPLLVEDNLYLICDSGIASCLETATGRPRWTHRVGGTFSASPLLSEGKIYIVSEGGETTIFRADPKRYVEIARNKLGERTLASPGVVDNALLIRTDSALYRIENR